MRTPEQVLLEAADYIEEHGLCKGRLSTKDGRVCLLGAINVVTSGFLDDLVLTPAAVFARGRLQDVIGDEQIARWNDRKETTKELAVEALRKAAAA